MKELLLQLIEMKFQLWKLKRGRVIKIEQEPFGRRTWHNVNCNQSETNGD